jgi:hypothetical protein
MRNTMMSLVVATVAAALCAATAWAAAPAGTLRAQRLGAAKDIRWLGQAGPNAVAWRPPTWDPAPAVVRYDDGRLQTVPAPTGCGAWAAGSGRVAYDCGEDRTPDGGLIRHLAVTSLTGDEIVRLDAHTKVNDDGGSPIGPDYVGAQWIRTANGCYHCGSWWEDVNWRTGEVRETYNTDPRLVADLDAPGLLVSLCAPLQAVPRPSVEESWPLYDVTVRDGWAVIEHPPGQIRATLYRCGSSRPVRLFPDGAPVLGDGWVGQSWKTKRHGWILQLVRLADLRRFAVTGLPAHFGRTGSLRIIAFTRGRAYLGISIDHWPTAPTETATMTIRLPHR